MKQFTQKELGLVYWCVTEKLATAPINEFTLEPKYRELEQLKVKLSKLCRIN
jgi:hypothetical protein